MKAKTTYYVDRVLHWVAALSILLMLTDMGTRIHYVDYQIKGIVQHKQDAIQVHITFAIMMLLSVSARLIWSKYILHPDHQLQLPKGKHKGLVKLVHGGMYLILLALVVTGILMVTNYEHSLHFYNWLTFSDDLVNRSLFVLANEWHILIQNAFYFMIALHVAGAIYNKK